MDLLRFKSLPEQRKIYVLSLLVGLCAGFSAVLLDFLIHLIRGLLTSGFSDTSFHWQYLVYPGVGMFLSFLLLRFVVKDNISHGVTKVLLAVCRNDSRIKPHNTWTSVLTSSVTIGFGGSVGAEAPIVYTGAAIGSNIGKMAGLSYRAVTILLGCGAAAAVAGIFKAPLAGVLFTVEILLFNISLNSLLPLLLSTITATVVSYTFRGQDPLFACSLVKFSMANIPFYIILGVVAGFVSVYFTRTTLKLEDYFSGFNRPIVKWLCCALGLGLLIFIFPELYGEGYEVISLLLEGKTELDSSPLSFLTSIPWGIPLLFILVILLKVVAMTLTNAGGGVGGTFGPTLFVGAIVGFVVSRSLNLLPFLELSVPEPNFVLVGMAALMAGVMQAPLTAIFLIAEISGGYELLIPLILTSTITFATTRKFERYSIYTKRIAQSGDLLTHDSDQAALTLMKLTDLVRDKYPKIHPEQTLRELVSVVSNSTAQVVAVIDENGYFQGMIDIGHIHKELLDVNKYDKVFVYNLQHSDVPLVSCNEKMESVMEKFDRTGEWRLPVVDADNKYIGFISRSRVLMAYRSALKEISSED